MREQTKLEEKYNYQSHGFGFVLSIMAFVLLVLTSNKGSFSTVFASCVYGLSLCILYFCSAKYHYTMDPVKKMFYRKLDHISIYVLIAGTYTPYTLVFLGHSKGVLLFGIVWSIALLGTFLKTFFTGRFEVVSLLLYLVMGWLIVFDFTALQQAVSPRAISLLVVGGVFYTTGILFYVWNSLKYNHVLWHLFVLAGSICHFFSIYLELI
ncbi:hemolysin III family protein [Flavobacteriaceae bacterium]|nr:hemolysin III family protein [Flavobacteriaceae bacterium]